jgi:hypothetical protein
MNSRSTIPLTFRRAQALLETEFQRKLNQAWIITS